mgnify:CR=1 FL=1|tara:strand:+ start:663 stop:836 length:174 start_codon:yes stop_codon:yes gene_type:complete
MSELTLDVMTSTSSTTKAETFNSMMAIHTPCGNGIITLTKEQAMEFFDLQHKVKNEN